MIKTIQFYKKVVSYFKPFRGVLFISFLLSIIPSALMSSNQYVLGKIADALFAQNDLLIKKFIILLAVLLVAKQFFSRFETIFDIKKIEFSLGTYLSRITLEKSFNLSLGQLKQEHSGFKQDVLRTGANQMNQLMFMIVYEVVPLITTAITAAVGLYFLNINFLYIVLIFSFLYFGIGSYLNRKMREPIKNLIKKRIEINKIFVDILQNLFLLKFSNKMKQTSSRLESVQEKHNDFGINIWVKYNYTQIISDIILLIYYVACVWYSLFLIKTGLMSVGMFIPLTAWMMSVASSVGQLRKWQRRLMIAQSDIEKMFDMLEQKSDIVIDPHARSIKKLEDSILFENLQFDYKDGKKRALENINFEIKKGEKVALVGRSGSGKTTIVSLLLRLYDPQEGTILIDGIDLKSLVLEDWHNMIGYVPQEGDLLDISIKENILFGTKKRITNKEIEDVLEKAGIKEFIHNLPNGIDTIVGERGVKLSGGQKQRVCIARALIKDAPLLLLDEATSSLDSETETVVNKAIWEMLGDKTGVVIAHRLSTIIDADKIIVMDHGKIVGIGTHEELIKTTPYYKKLVDAQNVNL